MRNFQSAMKWLAVASAFLMVASVRAELSYDEYFKDIYRKGQNIQDPLDESCPPCKNILCQDMCKRMSADAAHRCEKNRCYCGTEDKIGAELGPCPAVQSFLPGIEPSDLAPPDYPFDLLPETPGGNGIKPIHGFLIPMKGRYTSQEYYD